MISYMFLKQIHIVLILFLGLHLASTSAQLQPNDTGRVCNPGSYNNGNLCLECPPRQISTSQNSFLCTLCPANQYPDSSGTKCMFCPKGYFIGAYSRCRICPLGTYSETAGQKSCKKCEFPNASTFSAGMSTKDACSNCGPGSFVNAWSKTRAECQDCAPGTYGIDCHGKCPSGMTSNIAAATKEDCFFCPAGKRPNPRLSRECTRCPSGFFKPTSEGDCLSCPEGSVSTPDRTQCRSESDAIGCAPGTQPSKDGSKCVSCGEGTYNSFQSTTQCVKCNYEFIPSADKKSCVCKKGSIRVPYDNSICGKCPKFSTSVTPWKCACKQGLVLNRRAAKCTCKVGEKFKNRSGPECRKCTRNELAKNINDECNFCSYDQYYDEKKNQCFACPKGEQLNIYNKPHLETNCTACETEHVDRNGTVEKRKSCGCEKGYGNRGYRRCFICKPGTSNSPFSSGCEDCGSGSFSDTFGLTRCKRCPLGRRHGNKYGQKECPSPCPKNAFERRRKCTCKNGFANEVSSTGEQLCVKCASGILVYSYYPRKKCDCAKGFKLRGNKCDPCRVGTFKPYSSSICSICSPFSFTDKVGSASCEKCGFGSFSLFQKGRRCVKCTNKSILFKNGTCGKCDKGERIRNGVCVPCLPEFYSFGGDMAYCLPCPEGKLRSTTDGSKCV